jgi:prepilin-type N-terminal cleavage/methylation domain-containing protein
MQRKPSSRGFSLVELVLVVAVLAFVAVIAAGHFSGLREKSLATAVSHDLREIRNAFTGTDDAPGYLGDMSPLPGFTPGFLRLADLLTPTNRFAFGGTRADAAASAWDDGAGRGWRGPYVRLDRPDARGGAARFPAPGDRPARGGGTFEERGFFPAVASLSLPADVRDERAAYGFAGEPALLDPWGAPYVLQIPPPQAFVDADGHLADVPDEERFRYARVVSAGPDGVLSTPCFSGGGAGGASWNAAARRASIFAGRPADRGDDLVLFLLRSDVYHEDYEKEGDPR